MYRVNDLLPADEHAPRDGIETIADLIRENVELESWTAYGGDVGTILELGDALVIQTTPEIHLAVEDYLDSLRP